MLPKRQCAWWRASCSGPAVALLCAPALRSRTWPPTAPPSWTPRAWRKAPTWDDSCATLRGTMLVPAATVACYALRCQQGSSSGAWTRTSRGPRAHLVREQARLSADCRMLARGRRGRTPAVVVGEAAVLGAVPSPRSVRVTRSLSRAQGLAWRPRWFGTCFQRAGPQLAGPRRSSLRVRGAPATFRRQWREVWRPQSSGSALPAAARAPCRRPPQTLLRPASMRPFLARRLRVQRPLPFAPELRPAACALLRRLGAPAEAAKARLPMPGAPVRRWCSTRRCRPRTWRGPGKLRSRRGRFALSRWLSLSQPP